MKEQLITFETAKLAKEKGFNEMCNYAHSEDDKGIIDKDKNHKYLFRNDSMSDEVSGYISAPTQSLLQKWLREKYNIHIHIMKAFEADWFFLNVNGYDTDYNEKSIKTYEKALEKGLQEALKLIK